MVASTEGKIIPSELRVEVEGRLFTLRIRVEPVYDFMAVITDRKLPDWVVDKMVPAEEEESLMGEDSGANWEVENSKNNDGGVSVIGIRSNGKEISNRTEQGADIDVAGTLKSIPRDTVGNGYGDVTGERREEGKRKVAQRLSKNLDVEHLLSPERRLSLDAGEVLRPKKSKER